jgi:hypothetical protein
MEAEEGTGGTGPGARIEAEPPTAAGGLGAEEGTGGAGLGARAGAVPSAAEASGWAFICRVLSAMRVADPVRPIVCRRPVVS